MADCGICQKTVATSLYIRAKPIWDGKGTKWVAKKDKHSFFGYWPPDSHLAEYFRLELARRESILQPLFVNNCRGHSVDEIADAIEAKVPPLPGIPVKLLWNPSPRVSPYLLAESWRERADAQLETNGDLRTVTVHDISSVRTSLLNLLNNAQNRTEQSISHPGKPVMQH